MKHARIVSVAVVVIATAYSSSRGIMGAPSPFYPDSSLQATDSTPFGRPILGLRKITRGRGPTELPNGIYHENSEGDIGTITCTLTFPDEASRPRGRFGYTWHFVDGDLPLGLGFTSDAWSTAMRADTSYPYIDWGDGRTWGQDPFSFRVYVTAIDSAGNESPPSNTIVIADDGKQEDLKRVDYEKYYLSYGSPFGAPVHWTGTDEVGSKVSLMASLGERIELVTPTETILGAFQMQPGRRGADPNWIDIYRRDFPGSPYDYFGPVSPPQLGIYEMDGDNLRLCLARPGAVRPSKFQQDDKTRLYSLKRVP